MDEKNEIQIDKDRGLIRNAEIVLSPNFNERPANAVIDLLVIHNISLPPAHFEGDAVSNLFQNKLDVNSHPYFQKLKNLKVSAHLFIRRSGHLIQFVPFHLRAWHAGVSSYEGKESCNDFSIGIELEGTDEIPYTEEQYRKLAWVTTEIIRIYPEITLNRIVGHQMIAPTRKTDPGPSFDWSYFFKLLTIHHRIETPIYGRLHHSN